jgi:hypothetical protein
MLPVNAPCARARDINQQFSQASTTVIKATQVLCAGSLILGFAGDVPSDGLLSDPHSGRKTSLHAFALASSAGALFSRS